MLSVAITSAKSVQVIVKVSQSVLIHVSLFHFDFLYFLSFQWNQNTFNDLPCFCCSNKLAKLVEILRDVQILFHAFKQITVKLIENPESERMWNIMAYLLESPYNLLLNHMINEIVCYYCLSITLIFWIPGFPLRRQYSQFEAETLGQTERGKKRFLVQSALLGWLGGWRR